MDASRAAAETEVDAAHRDRRKRHCSKHLETEVALIWAFARSSSRRLAFAAVLR